MNWLIWAAFVFKRDVIYRSSTLNSFMKSVSGQLLGGSIKDYVNKDKKGLEKHEFIDFYRSILNSQKNQSEALAFVFYKVKSQFSKVNNLK